MRNGESSQHVYCSGVVFEGENIPETLAGIARKKEDRWQLVLGLLEKDLFRAMAIGAELQLLGVVERALKRVLDGRAVPDVLDEIGFQIDACVNMAKCFKINLDAHGAMDVGAEVIALRAAQVVLGRFVGSAI